MAIQPPENLLHLLGLVAWGDIAELTLFKTKRGKVVTFHKSYPEGPPSVNQQWQRARFRAASAGWVALPAAAKQNWELATKRLSLPMTGYDLWMSWLLAPDRTAMETIERHSHLTLL